MDGADLLKGMPELINPQNVKSGVQYDEIAKSLMSNGAIESSSNDPTESFKQELHSLAKSLNISFESPRRDSTPARQLTPDKQASPAREEPAQDKSHDYSEKSYDFSSYVDYTEDAEDNSAKEPENKGNEYDFPNFDYSANTLGSFSAGTPKTELERRTDEEQRHAQVRNVMSEMGGNKDSAFISLEQAKREEEKTIMLEEIDSIRGALEEECAIGLDKIPKVDSNSTFDEVENVLKRLRLKNDRARYTSLADEFILWGADAMEELFNGERMWFGRYNPDLRGWRKEVQIKLRRMRHDTSTLVSNVMHDYNIGPGPRILLELIPNMFMYARRKKNNYNKPDMYLDDDISKAYENIRDFD